MKRWCGLLAAFLLGHAWAQISFPPENLTQALGVNSQGRTFTYNRGTVQLELLAGLVYKVGYRGPATDYLGAGRVLAVGIGEPKIAEAFLGFMRQNADKLRGKGPQNIGVVDGFTFTLTLAADLSFTLAPVEIKDFGPDRHVLGKSGVMIREFSDFQCPYCKQFTLQVKPELEKRYINPGLARFSFRHFPLTQIHPQAMPAALAAECAAQQGKFFEYHDALFEKGINVSARAQELKLDELKLLRCTQDPATRQIIESDLAMGNQVGVNGTPTVFVGPFRLPNAYDIDAYERYIKMANAPRYTP